MSAQVDVEDTSSEETMLANVAETWVPTTADVQSMASGHVPEKRSK
jgi:hypothetical protein